MRSNQSVDQFEFYLNEKADLVNALAEDDIDRIISDEVKRHAFIKGLNNGIRSHVEFAKPKTLQEAVHKAKEAEHAFGIKEQTSNNSLNYSNNKSNYKKGKRKEEKEKSYKKTCFYCNKPRHIKADCYKYQKEKEIKDLSKMDVDVVEKEAFKDLDD